MDFFMTRNTNRCNIEPMGFFISFVMVIFLCLFKAIKNLALKSIGCGHSAIFNSDRYGLPCFAFINITQAARLIYIFVCTALPIFFVISYIFRAMPISFIVCFCLVALGIFFTVLFFYYFAVWCVSVISPCGLAALSTLKAEVVVRVFIFAKILAGLNFLAMRTSFCFNWFRHGFFLIKKLCFEPLEGRSLCGSFYYIPSCTFCQGENLGKQ